MTESSPPSPRDFLDMRTTRRRFTGGLFSGAGVVGLATALNARGLPHNLRTGPEGDKNVDPFIANIENDLGVRLVTARQAFAMEGKDFQKDNPNILGPTPPENWDHESATLLQNLLTRLPEYMYKKDGEGKKLFIALTDSGTDCSCHASYNHSAESGKIIDSFVKPHNVMYLDKDAFSPKDERYSFSVLTHEAVHRYQHQDLKRQRMQFQRALGQDITKMAIGVQERMDRIEFPVDDDFIMGQVLHRLKYGFQTILDRKEQYHESDFVELQAAMSELYVAGKSSFDSYLTPIFGKDITLSLYGHLQAEVFDSRKYSNYREVPLI